MDRIIVLKNGQVSESGSYDELLKSQGAFSEFLMTYVNDDDTESDSEGTVEALCSELLFVALIYVSLQMRDQEWSQTARNIYGYKKCVL